MLTGSIAHIMDEDMEQSKKRSEKKFILLEFYRKCGINLIFTTLFVM